MKTALVTGGTDGIGRKIALGLVHAGHLVIIVGRDSAKGARVQEELQRTTCASNVVFLAADLSVIRESYRLADEVNARWPKLNYLVHSAGIVRGRWHLTSEGIESNFATNYLNRFALTSLLLPNLKAAGRSGHCSRILFISGAARHGTIHFQDVNLTSKFNMLRTVGQFCQANGVFAVELARRLTNPGGGPIVTANCLKVGVVKTNIRREFPIWMRVLVPLLDPFLAMEPEEVAASALRLLESGEYEGITGTLFSQVRRFKQIAVEAGVAGPDVSRRLWELSVRLTTC
ncbi:MAG: SDR family NAD(P)-dependent oxidoreductase [Acidobacteriia bacterium]|nr:SDR family NAD(P)-dependent oxidoreductase [Terriglobia bacterium]